MFAFGGFLKHTAQSLISPRVSRVHFLTAALLLFGSLFLLLCVSPLRPGLAARGRRALNSLTAPLQPASAPTSSVGASRAPAGSQDLQQQSCSLNCTATVPATGMINIPVAFQGSATATGCASAPTYEWNFGDGSPLVTQQNPSYSYAAAGTYNWTMTVRANTGATDINTVVGGLGDGNQAQQVPFVVPVAAVRDPQGRGIYLLDLNNSVSFIRFINTTNAAVNLAGRTVAAGAAVFVAGGGLDIDDNLPAMQTDLGSAAGIAVSNDGNLLYVSLSYGVDALIRAINVSAGSLTIGSFTVQPGRIVSLPTPAGAFGTGLGVLTVGPNGDVFVIDATAGVQRVYRVTLAGAVTPFAGNSESTKNTDTFTPGIATNIPLLSPRALEFDPSGNLFLADTGHGRVIRIDTGSQASLVAQFQVVATPGGPPPPYPSGLAFSNGKLYIAMGNGQTVVRVDGAATPVISGAANTSCAYETTNCGDGGPLANAQYNLTGSTSLQPITGIEADPSGLYLLDQGPSQRGRVRFLNLTGASVVLAGKTVNGNSVDTIAGNGLPAPFDNGLASSAAIAAPTGVALDPNGNLYFTDTTPGNLRFVNRGTTPVTLFPGTEAQQTVPPGVVVRINKDVGTGTSSNDVPVNRAAFTSPQGLFVTSQGIYIADSAGGPNVPPQTINSVRSGLIRFVNTTAGSVTLYPGSSSPIVVPAGEVTTIAGGGLSSSSVGDNGFALSAKFLGPSDVVVTADGTIYIADPGNKRVRKIHPQTGVVTSLSLPSGLKQYTGLALDSTGRLYITNYDDGQVLRESATTPGSFARMDVGTSLLRPRDVAVDANGNAYVVNSELGFSNQGTNAHRIMRVAADGVVTTFAGTSRGFSGDGGPATSAQLNVAPANLNINSINRVETPMNVGIVVTTAGQILFADSNNGRIRALSPAQSVCTKTGQITIAGQNPAPVLTGLNPTSALQNSGAFTLTLTGTGFVPASVVRWNGADRTTSFVSTTQLTAQILATDITSAGTAQLTVFNPTPGGGTSSAQTFTITAPNPTPAITSLSPSSALEGGPDFTLTVNGTGFIDDSVVRWDGSPRTTTFVSATQLTALISSNDLIGTGTSQVTVFNPAPGGGMSAPATFTISATNPVPALTSLSPNATPAAGPAFTLAITGTNFVTASKVRWNGNDRPTTFVNATQLTAQIPASDIASIGTAQVTVFTPTPGGGVSAPLTFTITNPVPSLASLSPTAVAAGSNAFTLTVNGGNFVNGAVVRWNGADRQTAFISATQLTAQITAADVTSTGTAQVTVFNPAPGGGASSALTFTITATNPAPTLASLTPSTVLAGGAAFTLTLNGSNFIPGSIVRWNGADRQTTFVNATTLTIQVPAADIATAGLASLTVFNPAPGGGTSGAVNLPIVQPNPVPTLASLNPSFAVVNGGGFTLTVTGTNFINGAVVQWNGAARPTTFVSATQLTAQIPAADVTTIGNVAVTVANPAPGGGTSNAVQFQVLSANAVPVLTSLSPNTTQAGGGAFTLTVNGTNFVNGSTVRWNGENRQTNFVSAAQLTALITAADIANTGTAQVTVLNPAGTTSNALSFNITPPNPAPTLTSVNPTSANAGGAEFTLTVTGTNFINGSVVRWNGNTRTTVFVNSTSLSVQIPASDIASAGTAQITVFNPAPGGGTSNSLSFPIVQPNPVPTLTALNPNSVAVGSGAFTLTLTGTNFINTSVVTWNGATRTTNFVNATTLTIQVPAADVANAATVELKVTNPAPGGGTSNGLNLTIVQPNPAPTLTGLNPSTVGAGSGAFTLTLTGTGFTNSSSVWWNGAVRPSVFVNTTTLTLQVPAADIASAGTVEIKVVNPAPGGGTSNSLNLTIVPPNPVPSIATLTPATVTAGSAGFTLTITGTGFINSSVVQWNGQARPTTFGNATTLTIQVAAADVASLGTAEIKVVNPAPGGGMSNAVLFAIQQGNPLPGITTLAPAQALAGSNGFTLTVNGSSFINGSVVRWNGAARPTTFLNPTQLTAQISAADVAAVGPVQVTVFTPTPGGGVSNAATFNVIAPNPSPTITALAPNLVIAGGSGFTLTVTGTGFINGSRIRWNGTELATTFVSATQLTAQLAAADIANAGTARITVINVPPGGGVSSEAALTIARPAANVSAASYLAQAFAPDSIVAAFGLNLATGVELATAVPLPTNLRGTTVLVRDSAGKEQLAALFFVAPGQVNYLLPTGLAAGSALVIITSGGGEVSANLLTISPTAPALFSANANGAGVAAAVALRVRTNGEQVFEPVAQLNSTTGRQVPVPISLGPEGEQVYLVAFGSGIRGRSSLNAVTATLGGVPIPVSFAQAQGSLAGLDQVNLGPVPRSLANRGVVDLIISVDGKQANTVQFSIQ
jgi:uncharacterized protein (TIGR03437 family)